MEKVILIKDKPYIVLDCKQCFGSGSRYGYEKVKCDNCQGYGYIAKPINVLGEPK